MKHHPITYPTLNFKAQEIGYHPEMILAGCRLNDGMGAYVAHQVIQFMARRQLPIHGARLLILGLTFKENCPDLRNTRVIDLITEPESGRYQAIILAVAHAQFREQGHQALRAYGQPGAVLYDVKHLFPADAVDGRL